MGFWFEPVTYSSSQFGGPLTAEELKAIDTIARAEIMRAFKGLRIVLWEPARQEQYYGEIRWGDAWPTLYRRFNSPRD